MAATVAKCKFWFGYPVIIKFSVNVHISEL